METRTAQARRPASLRPSDPNERSHRKLRFFDQIQFFSVSPDELTQAQDISSWRLSALHRERRVSFADYKAFLLREQDGISAFKHRQQAAFEAERSRWKDSIVDEIRSDGKNMIGQTADASDQQVGIYTEASGNIWKVLVDEGADAKTGDPVIAVESMKMEIPVLSTSSGVVQKILVRAGQTLHSGDLICIQE